MLIFDVVVVVAGGGGGGGGGAAAAAAAAADISSFVLKTQLHLEDAAAAEGEGGQGHFKNDHMGYQFTGVLNAMTYVHN